MVVVVVMVVALVMVVVLHLVSSSWSEVRSGGVAPSRLDQDSTYLQARLQVVLKYREVLAIICSI